MRVVSEGRAGRTRTHHLEAVLERDWSVSRDQYGQVLLSLPILDDPAIQVRAGDRLRTQLTPDQAEAMASALMALARSARLRKAVGTHDGSGF